MKKYNKILTKELNRILPYHLLGVILHTVVIYMCFKIPQCIGNILDMLIDGNVEKDLIIHQAYLVIFYSSFVFYYIKKIRYIFKKRSSKTFAKSKARIF